MSFQRKLIQRALDRGKVLKWSPEDFLAASLDELVERLVEAGGMAFERASCALFLLDGLHLALAATVGSGLELGEHGRVAVDEGVLGRTAKRGEPLLLPNTSLEGPACPCLPAEGSAMIVPFALQRKPLGLFVLYRRAPPFSRDDLQHAVLFAGQAALAITLQRALDERTRALAESESRYRLIAENVADMICTADRDRVLTFVSPSIRHLAGYEPQELIGSPFERLLTPASQEIIHQTYVEGIEQAKALVVGEAVSLPKLELELAARDGRTVVTEATGSLLLTPDGTLSFLGVIRDISARRMLEAQLRQAQKMEAVGCLAAGVSHEINNPLGVILGFAQGIERRTAADAPERVPIAAIVREALRCKNLVQELLTFSRTSKRCVEPVDLGAVIRSALVLLHARAKTQNVAVAEEIADDLPAMQAERTQVQQVLVNLGTNALDAMTSGGELTVRAAQADGGSVLLEVADTGTGIAEDHRSRIFEPFFTTKEVGKGTGLGLSLVYEIVQQHGGTIDVQSEVGRGTTIRVRFPTTAGERA
jgi:PAS domain S-box-containing protein